MASKTKVASDLFRQKWFRELSPELKLLWIFLTLESNIVGAFEVDPDSWNFFIGGTKLKADDIFRRFGGRFQRIPNHPDKAILVGKLDFQCAFGRNSAQWKWVEKELESLGLTYDALQKMKSHEEEEQMELPLGIEEPAPIQCVRDDGPCGNPKTIPPRPEWIKAYCAERHYPVDAERFFDFYASKGWKVGKSPMKDWQAAVRTWAKDSDAKRPETSVTPLQVRRKF